MERVWKRIIATAERLAEREEVITDEQAREMVGTMITEVGVRPPSDAVFGYMAWSLARRTRQPH